MGLILLEGKKTGFGLRQRKYIKKKKNVKPRVGRQLTSRNVDLLKALGFTVQHRYRSKKKNGQ